VDISILIPVYNEAEALVPLYRGLIAAVADAPGAVEIIFCDDGSTDGSDEVLDDLA
jgi:glycosyltransferase involved in cell wall biosynthesis